MQTLGVAMIVKNEEAMLGRCLESVKGADAIFIADTGSEDNTIEVARRYTKNIYTDFVWNDNFADARNFIKSKVTTDYILSIDADETLHDMAEVRRVIEMGHLVINIKQFAEDNRTFNWFPRVFKNDPRVFWVGAIHNHISVTPTLDSDVAITYGYSPAHFQDPNRAMRILEREAQRPDGVRERFYLGREYWYRRRYDDTVVLLGRYVQESNHLSEKAEAFLMMAQAYWHMGEHSEDARDAILQALKINANFKEAILFMAMLSGDGRGVPAWQQNADQWKRMADTANNEKVLFIRSMAEPVTNANPDGASQPQPETKNDNSLRWVPTPSTITEAEFAQ